MNNIYQKSKQCIMFFLPIGTGFVGSLTKVIGTKDIITQSIHKDIQHSND